MIGRYDLREDHHGWTVFDIWTAAPVIIRETPQVGLDIQDADELAEALTWLADRGERRVMQ
jgi:hypothetical protein